MYNMLNDAMFTQVMNPVSAGTTEQKSNVLDMQGFDSVMFILSLGTVTDGCVLTATAYENTASSASSPTPVAVTGGSCTFTASGSSNTVMIVDVQRPANRYIFLDVMRTTANAVINCVIAIQYHAASGLPITQGSTVLASAISKPEA